MGTKLQAGISIVHKVGPGENRGKY